MELKDPKGESMSVFEVRKTQGKSLQVLTKVLPTVATR